MTVAQQANRILEVWECGNRVNISAELSSAEALCSECGVSLFERERRELLASIVDDMRTSLQARRENAADTAMLLLRHLRSGSDSRSMATARPTPIRVQ